MRNLLSLIVSIFLCVIANAPTAANDRLIVFAPSSMTEIMNDVASAYQNESGNEVAMSFAGTPQLARQLDAGAPAGYFLTADRRWIDWALERKLVVSDTVNAVAGNSLVLAVRNEVENWADAKALVTQNRFAMAEPDSVPAGRYAKQALQHQGLWKEAEAKAVFGDNVRITLNRLAMGEVEAAIVYGTDVAAEPRVKTFLVYPAASHDPIVYWGAVTIAAESGGQGEGARKFAEFLAGPTAGALFAKFGFLPPGTKGQ